MAEKRALGLRLHSRTMQVSRAEAEFRVVVLAFLDAHDDLTDIELAGIMLLAPAIPIKYALRAERHPEDPSRKADEE
jgi:hypothetical protein